jgi:tetratricopeptide (TPR) repeat protein
LSQAYSILGHAQDQSGDYESALQSFQQQLLVANQLGDDYLSALSHEGSGVVLNHLERYPEALNEFNEQYKIGKQSGQTLPVGYAAMNRGTMLWQLGQYEEAVSALNEASSIAEKGGDSLKELVAWIRVSRARMALSRGDAREAKRESLAAIEIAGTEMKAIAIQSMSNLGLAETMTGNPAAGQQRCQEAVDLARTLRDPKPLSGALLSLSQAFLGVDREKAISAAQESQSRFRTWQQQDSEWRSWAVLYRINPTPEGMGQVRSILTEIERQWGREVYLRYLRRTDVKEMLSSVDTASR